MAKMSIIYQINLDQEMIDQVSEILKDQYDAKDVKIVEIGFGIRALQVLFILDEGYPIDELEMKLGEIEGVSSVQVVGMNRLG
ncbi:MAG: elongation factor 1-beta family protein [Candidatus Anstonellales archaeon]